MTVLERRSRRCMMLAAFTIAALFLAGEAGDLAASDERRAPSQGDARKGEKIFNKYCAGCHGTGGQGDGYRLLGPNPADLTTPSTQRKPDAALLATIHEGKPNMPAWRFRFSDEDSRDVLAYVWTLGRHK